MNNITYPEPEHTTRAEKTKSCKGHQSSLATLSLKPNQINDNSIVFPFWELIPHKNDLMDARRASELSADAT